ncbi:MAG: plastocyanin/azurin family copper-binding protein [Halobacteriota archaeon]
MRRREFLLGSVGAGGAAMAASGSSVGRPTGEPGLVDDGRLHQEEDGDVVEVALVDFEFDPGTDSPLEIEPGTTVRFVWETDTHNIVVDSQPDDADWEGQEEIENSGFEYEFTFEVEGTYEFHCEPHLQQGMEGTIEVGETDGDGAGPLPPAERELDPHEIGVPLQKHFIGFGTFFGITLTLVFVFYVLKYGESAHTGSPNRRR